VASLITGLKRKKRVIWYVSLSLRLDEKYGKGEETPVRVEYTCAGRVEITKGKILRLGTDHLVWAQNRVPSLGSRKEEGTIEK